MTASEGDARFRLMFERSADAILLLDAKTNRFVEYNQATLDMLRCSRDEMRELHPSELSPPRQPDGRPSFEKANEMIAAAIARGSNRFEWVHRSPNRDDFPVEVLLTPIQPGPNPVLLVVWRDITERRQSDEALRQAQKLESLGVLASGVAHDFNNLLTVVAGNVTLIRASLPREHEVNSLLSQVESAVFKAAELTRQMLAYGGKGAFVVEPIDLKRTVNEIAELLRVSIPRRVQVNHDLAAVPPVLADRAQLQQVVMNLVTNAAEAIGDAEGAITIRTGAVTLDDATISRDFRGQELAPTRYARLEVTDSGHGMTPEVLSRIFDPFYTTKSAGRGLGLSALRGIVRSHHGGLRIRSEPGRGTTFEVFFPAAEQAPRVDAPVHATPPRSAKVRATVLLVDDERLVRRTGAANLRQLGCTVFEAADGEEALTVFREHLDEIDFVLLDLTMPGMGGHETFRQLRLIDPGVRVVLCSGWAESDLAEQFHDALPAAFLAKPYRTTDLKRVFDAVGLDSSGMEQN